MFIAKQKRKENIAEYILYLWQIEDLLRALEFDDGKIRSALIDPLTIEEKKKQDTFFWYAGIANILKEEKKETVGHTRHSLHLINELNYVHLYLLKKDKKYSNIYNVAKSDIEDFADKSGKRPSNEVETCFDALYSKLLMRMKGMTIFDETSSAFDRITHMIAYLSAKFKRFEQGEEIYDPEN